jgi:hypothetical protein
MAACARPSIPRPSSMSRSSISPRLRPASCCSVSIPWPASHSQMPTVPRRSNASSHPRPPLLAALFQTIGKAEYGLRSLLKTLYPKDSEIKSLATNGTWPAPTRLRELAKITQHT